MGLNLGVAGEQGEEGKEDREESSCVHACSKHQIICSKYQIICSKHQIEKEYWIFLWKGAFGKHTSLPFMSCDHILGQYFVATNFQVQLFLLYGLNCVSQAVVHDV